jgi:hypothetical protein
MDADGKQAVICVHLLSICVYLRLNSLFFCSLADRAALDWPERLSLPLQISQRAA